MDILDKIDEYYKKGHKFAQRQLDAKRKKPDQKPLHNKKLEKKYMRNSYETKKIFNRTYTTNT
jgi:hypothetical protein